MGGTFASSLAQGIRDGAGSVIGAAVSMVIQAIAAARAAAESASPSKVWMREGRNWVAGLVQGIQKEAALSLTPAVERMTKVQAAMPGMSRQETLDSYLAASPGSRIIERFIAALEARGIEAPGALTRGQTFYVDRLEIHGDPREGLAALGLNV